MLYDQLDLDPVRREIVQHAIIRIAIDTPDTQRRMVLQEQQDKQAAIEKARKEREAQERKDLAAHQKHRQDRDMRRAGRDGLNREDRGDRGRCGRGGRGMAAAGHVNADASRVSPPRQTSIDRSAPLAVLVIGRAPIVGKAGHGLRSPALARFASAASEISRAIDRLTEIRVLTTGLPELDRVPPGKAALAQYRAISSAVPSIATVPTAFAPKAWAVSWSDDSRFDLTGFRLCTLDRPQHIERPDAKAITTPSRTWQRVSVRKLAIMLAGIPACLTPRCLSEKLVTQIEGVQVLHVIVCASRKGGSGKGVSARHMAVAAMQAGMRVAMIDLDPMIGLTRWWGRRAEDALELIDLTPDGVLKDTPAQRLAASEAAARALAAAIPNLLASGHQLLVIDTPPAADDIVRLAVAVADLVIVPVRPSPDDLDAIGETVDLVSATGKPMVFVINAATRKARLTQDAAIALSQHGTVSPAILHRADAYAASGLDGRTVQEVDPNGKPAEEVAALWAYVRQRLGLQACKLDGIPSGKKALRMSARSSSKEARK